MPRVAAKNSNAMKNKGFCYMFFKNVEQMKAVLELSESHLNGRNMLIKDSENYSGRPDKDDLVAMSKNPPSRILFVGNLSFDVTDDLLRKHFQHCGDIVKIRMATFEDSGKCKGFAFIDFKNEEGSTNALKDKSCRKIAGRPCEWNTVKIEVKDKFVRRLKMYPETIPHHLISLTTKDTIVRDRITAANPNTSGPTPTDVHL